GRDRHDVLFGTPVRLPNLPRSFAASAHVVELLLILEGVHRGIKAVVSVRNQLTFLHEARERLQDKFFAVADVIENLALEDEIAAVNANRRFADGLDLVDKSVLSGGNDVVGQIRFCRDESGDTVVMTGKLEQLGKRQVGETVG